MLRVNSSCEHECSIHTSKMEHMQIDNGLDKILGCYDHDIQLQDILFHDTIIK